MNQWPFALAHSPNMVSQETFLLLTIYRSLHASVHFFFNELVLHSRVFILFFYLLVSSFTIDTYLVLFKDFLTTIDKLFCDYMLSTKMCRCKHFRIFCKCKVWKWILCVALKFKIEEVLLKAKVNWYVVIEDPLDKHEFYCIINGIPL